MALRHALLSTALAVMGAQVSVAQELGSLRSAVNARIAAQGMLIWSSDRPLARADFQGVVPVDTSTFGAVSAVGLLHAIRCDADHLEFAVFPMFLPSGSWTRPDVLLDGPQGAHELAHEQGHFDLTEISARQLRAELKRFNVPCDSANAAFTAIAEAADARHAALQTQYDDETVHATKRPEQDRWLAMIKATLDTLPAGAPWTSRRYWRP